MKLYLHIGMPKTASSAIQAFLTLNAEVLADSRIAYPDPPTLHPDLITGGNIARFERLFRENDLAEIRRSITSYIAVNPTSDKLVLSAEGLFHILRRWPDRFVKAFVEYDYQVICYVRRQDELISSAYNQLVKNHDYTDRSALHDIAVNHDFTSTLLGALDYMEAETIVVRPYERGQFRGGDIYSDFMHCIGVDLLGTEPVHRPEQPVNPSLGPHTLEFRRLLNLLGVDRGRPNGKRMINSLLHKYAEYSGDSRRAASVFSAAERAALLSFYAEPNAAVARRFLGRERLFYDELPADDETSGPADLALNKVMDICGYILERRGLASELPSIVAKGTSEAILDGRGLAGLVRDQHKETAYTLVSRPTNLSRDVARMERKYGSWYIESTGDDPYFTIPGFSGADGHNVLQVWISITSMCETNLEVFFLSDNGRFDGEHKVGTRINKGYNDVVLEMDGRDPITSLRLDPGQAEGIYLLHSFEVRI